MTATIIIILLLFGLILILNVKGRKPEDIATKVDSLIQKANTLTYKTESCRVVGINYRGPKANSALRAAEDYEFVNLVAEPENEYDSSAVKVLLDDVHIGYIPRDISFEIANSLKYLDYAQITDKGKSDGEWFVMINIVFHAPKGLTDDEFTFVSTHAPERLKELIDPSYCQEQ